MGSHLVRRGPGMLCLALLTSAAPAVAPPAERPAGGRDDSLVLARKIDRHVNAGLEARKAVAAPLAGDGEFVRRVYLDLAGRIPRVSEVRAFLDDRSPDKRRRLVEKLLTGPNYVYHLTNVWRALLIPSGNEQAQFLNNSIQDWVRPRVRDNVPYDKVARELVTAAVGSSGNLRAPGAMPVVAGGPIAFYQANEHKPENLAAATSRLLLGVKIECAQCHDHPFAKWTKKQFWEYAAFFSGIRSAGGNQGLNAAVTDVKTSNEITIAGSEKKVKAKFLDGTEPGWKDDVATREVLADWMTRPDNPFFARTAVNRMWEHFFGVGLVDPTDDFRDENPASHPELLDELARAFVEHKYDLKYLIRAITSSQAYQRSSEQTDASQEDLRSFARMPLKGLTPEQVFDSLATAVGFRGERMAPRFGQGGSRGEIQSRFSNPVDRRTETQTSILQALALMNGRFVSDATSLERSETLAAVIDLPFLSTREKLDALFMAALSRPMRGSEVGRFVPYVEGGGPSRDGKRALADVFWVLLNSSEFILNH
ncbi:MAG: DUF1549 and DUF1553 domain-containing protein [Gemmataceae bacterium]